MARLIAWACGAAALAILLAACGDAKKRSRGTGTGTAVIAAAGDVACDPDVAAFDSGHGRGAECRQQATADLLGRGDYDAVLALGDLQYEESEAGDWGRAFGPSWGRYKAIMRPAIGNHEYGVDDASSYFDYFNGAGRSEGRAGGRGKGWYSFDLAAWHLIALNSNCARIGGCGPGSPQHDWLVADLTANATKCTLAFMHHPRFSSGRHGNDPDVPPLFEALYEAGADVVLSGHDHDYERFSPQSPAASLDRERGMRQFVVGTGGRSLRGFGDIEPNSRARTQLAMGVLELVLRPDGYDWAFVPIDGHRFSDRGSDVCH